MAWSSAAAAAAVVVVTPALTPCLNPTSSRSLCETCMRSFGCTLLGMAAVACPLQLPHPIASRALHYLTPFCLGLLLLLLLLQRFHPAGILCRMLCATAQLEASVPLSAKPLSRTLATASLALLASPPMAHRQQHRPTAMVSCEELSLTQQLLAL
jgi:hypothetical protein